MTDGRDIFTEDETQLLEAFPADDGSRAAISLDDDGCFYARYAIRPIGEGFFACDGKRTLGPFNSLFDLIDAIREGKR